MAKSKSGGTRSYIRGRVGADVYSIGKDAKGKKQQVVRSLAETVANPQTTSQMRGRMIMSTIMQAVSELRPIIDHSFDNVIGAQPNISEFIRVNYAKVKADVAAHPASGNTFGLVMYGAKGAKQGAYQISDGKAAIPAALSITKASGLMVIDLTEAGLTMAGLKAALGFGAQDYITLVGLNATGAAEYVRLHINQSLADETVIAAGNVGDIFELDGNITPTIALSGNAVQVTDANIAGCCAFIVTRHQNGEFKHSKATLGASTDISYSADAALPTYPVGDQKFLNGGDQSFSPAPTPEPEPEPTPGQDPTLTFSAASGISNVVVQAGGANVNSGVTVAAGTSLSVSGQVAESGYHMEATINGNTIALTKNGTTYSGTATMPSANAVISMTKVADSPSPSPTNLGFTFNGSSVNEGATVNMNSAQQSTLVVTVPAGSNKIGKYAGSRYNDQNKWQASTPLAEGDNTYTIPANGFDSFGDTAIGYLDDLGEGLDWRGVFFTVHVDIDE